MPEGTSNVQKVYTAKEVAVLLGIQNSTVRKYCQLLEKSGYHIHKNEMGHRGFFDKDVLVLRNLIDLMKHPDMSLENAINVVIATTDMNDMSDRDTTKIAETPYITKAEFDEIQHKQMQFHRAMYERQEVAIKELMNRLDQQQEYIQNKLEKRDQLLLENIRNMQAEKEVAAAQQKNSFRQRLKWFFLGK